MNDHIKAAQRLLLHQFPHTKGLQNIVLLSRQQVKVDHRLGIIHDRGSHWILASNLRRNDNIVNVYNSIYSCVNAKTRNGINELFQPISRKPRRIQFVKTQKQVGTRDCELFSIAMATSNPQWTGSKNNFFPPDTYERPSDSIL